VGSERGIRDRFMTGRTPGSALEELKAPEAFDEERGGLCGEDSAAVAGRPRMSCAGWRTAPRAQSHDLSCIALAVAAAAEGRGRERSRRSGGRFSDRRPIQTRLRQSRGFFLSSRREDGLPPGPGAVGRGRHDRPLHRLGEGLAGCRKCRRTGRRAVTGTPDTVERGHATAEPPDRPALEPHERLWLSTRSSSRPWRGASSEV